MSQQTFKTFEKFKNFKYLRICDHCARKGAEIITIFQILLALSIGFLF